MPSVIPQVRFGEGGVHADLTPTSCKVGRLFLQGLRLVIRLQEMKFYD